MQQATPPSGAAASMPMPCPEGFPSRDGTPSGEGDDVGARTALELEPMFTTQDEQKELATLSIPDMYNVQSDLLGITAGMSGLNVDGGGTDQAQRATTASPGMGATLSRLDEELSRLPASQTAAYRRALTECQDQVSDERKMSFLEYEGGDAVLAANRLAKYWEFRLDLFGPERCFLPMTLDGAMKDEVTNLMTRRIHQLLPVTDTAGRAIIYMVPIRRNFEEFSVDQENMAFMYLMETVIEDAELRRRGAIVIYDGRNVQRKHYSPKIKYFAAAVDSSMPIHFRAFHVCHPSKLFYYVLFPVIKYFVSKDVRLRIKLHYGSIAEVLTELERYCLPKNRLPNELEGDIILDMNKWVTERMALENSRRNYNISTITVDGPVAKRLRSQSERNVSASATDEKASGKGKARGNKSDPRMIRAIEARLADNDLSLYDALIAGGFVYKEDRNDKDCRTWLMLKALPSFSARAIFARAIFAGDYEEERRKSERNRAL